MVSLGNDANHKITTDFKGKHILSLTQFTKPAIRKLFGKTRWLIKRLKKKKDIDILNGSVSTLLFFEPSTRTFMSFSSGIKKLGGQTVEFTNPNETSSFAKKESLEDSVRVFSTYTDLIIVRHPENGFIQKMAENSSVPVISGGEGNGEHPTQALYDLFTVQQKIGRLSKLKVLVLGDVKFSRCIHSLIKGLALYPGNIVYWLAPKGLELSRELEQDVKKQVRIVKVRNVNEIPSDCNVWYTNRIQRERFKSNTLYKKALRSLPVITPELLKKKGNKNLIILDPLPRVNNIDERVDDDSRALYLRNQLENGLYVRMALVALVLGKI